MPIQQLIALQHLLLFLQQHFCPETICLAALAVGAAKAQDVTLRGASLFDNNHAYSKTPIKLGELVNASGQKVTFDLRGNSELGIEPDYVNFLT